jgi:hypothetical protein
VVSSNLNNSMPELPIIQVCMLHFVSNNFLHKKITIFLCRNQIINHMTFYQVVLMWGVAANGYGKHYFWCVGKSASKVYNVITVKQGRVFVYYYVTMISVYALLVHVFI